MALIGSTLANRRTLIGCQIIRRHYRHVATTVIADEQGSRDQLLGDSLPLGSKCWRSIVQC